MRLGSGTSDINAPNKPSYGDNTYDDEETPHGTAYNGSDVGSPTRSRIYSERDLVCD